MPGTIARARELVLTSAAGLALAILMTWPLATDLSHLGRTLDVDADGQFSIWNIAWVARTIVADPRHLFDANIFYPHHLTLAYSEANILPGILGAPVWWLTRNPWLTTNIVMLLAFASAYVGAYYLLRLLSGDRRAAAVAAIFYACCPYVFSHLSHIQLLFTGGIPLSLLMVHRVAEKAGTRRGLALAAAIAAQGLCCAYYGVFAGLMAGFVTLVLAATRRLWRSAEYWTSIAIGAAGSIVIVLPFFLPYLDVQRESGFARTVADTARWAAAPRDYLVSSAHAHAWLLALVRRMGPWSGEVLFPGLLVTILGIAGFVLAVRSHGDTPRGRETAIVYGGLAALAFWASFGPNAGLYRVLYELPTFSFLRAPSRMGLVVVLSLSVFASIALASLFRVVAERRRTIVTFVAAGAAAAAIADLAVFPIRWYHSPDIPTAYAALAHSQKGAVAEFPFYGERIAFPLHARYMLFSTSHWMPLVNGYSDVIPLDFRQAAAVLDTFPSADAFAVLQRHHVRYITVHWDMFGPRRDEIAGRLARYGENLRTIAGDDRMTLYEIVRYP